MQNNPHGIVVKVENLELCRVFYRDILSLGEPIIDSNFWVEFRIGEGVSLVLEKVDASERLSVRKGRISWLYHVDDLNKTISLLKKHGTEPLAEKEERIGYRVIKFSDPEGNPFYLYSTQEEATENKQAIKRIETRKKRNKK